MKTPSLALSAALGLLLATWIPNASAQVLFNQDFSSSNTVANYVNATTPTQNQFTNITTPVGSTWSISGGKLSLNQTVNGNAGVLRAIDMAGSPVGALSFSVNIDFSFTSALGTRLLTGSIGSNTGAQAWMAYGIDSTGVANNWKIFGDPTATAYTGPQTLTIIANNSGATIAYTGPDSSAQSLIYGAIDLWVGNTRVFNDRTSGVNTTYALKQFGATVQNAGGGAGTYVFDNFNVQVVPEPATWGLFAATLAVGAVVRLRRKRH